MWLMICFIRKDVFLENILLPALYEERQFESWQRDAILWVTAQLGVIITAALIPGGEFISFAGTCLNNLIPDRGKHSCNPSFFH